jgi:hypothetical protein
LYSVFKSIMLRWTGTVTQEVYIIVTLGNLSQTDDMGYEDINGRIIVKCVKGTHLLNVSRSGQRWLL